MNKSHQKGNGHTRTLHSLELIQLCCIGAVEGKRNQSTRFISQYVNTSSREQSPRTGMLKVSISDNQSLQTEPFSSGKYSHSLVSQSH